MKRKIKDKINTLKRTKGLRPNINVNEITDMKNTFMGCKNDNKK